MNFRQPLSPRGVVRLPIGSLPHGRGGPQGLAASLQCDEPLHRLDAANGRQPSVAALYRALSAGPGRGHGDHHLPRLHPRDLPSGLEGRMRELPSGTLRCQVKYIYLPAEKRDGHFHALTMSLLTSRFL